MSKLTLLVLSILPLAIRAQTQQPVLPQLSPKAAYEDAVHPLEVTRQSMANWSNTEIAALTVSMTNAGIACADRDPLTFEGADLIDLARLCALGQNFPAVIAASTRYLAAGKAKPQRTQAYAALIDAQLHLKDESEALKSAQAMLTAVPYDALVAESVDEAIHFMQFLYTDDAVKLAQMRQPPLLAMLAATVSATPATLAYAGAEPPQSLHELYADGMLLATLQRLEKSESAAVASTVSDLDSALPATLAPDEFIPINRTRRQYAMLGKPLTDLAHPDPLAGRVRAKKPVALTSLNLPGQVPTIPAPHAITGLLLFPDWCAQCVRMAIKLPPTVFTVAGHEAYLYGLMAETVPPNRAPSTTAAATTNGPADAANILRGTPTLVVDPSFLETFGVDELPFLILTDSQGIVRVAQAVSDDALTPGGTIDSAIARVGASWSSPLLPSLATPRTAVGKR